MSIASSVGKVAMQGLNVYGSVESYKTNRVEGKGMITSAASVAFDIGLGIVAPEVAMVKMLADLTVGIGQGVKAYGEGPGRDNAKQVTNVYRGGIGGRFVDTQNAQTMRQRGLQAIQQSGYNINSVFGSEARTFYRGMR